MKNKEKQNFEVFAVPKQTAYVLKTNNQSKEKQIKEMAIKLQKMIREVMNDIEDYSWIDIAKELYKIMLPEDSVVLSREEYEELNEEIDTFNHLCNEWVKILNKLLKENKELEAENERLKNDNKYFLEMMDMFRKDNTDIRKETTEKILNTDFFIFEIENRSEEYQKGYMQAIRECHSRRDELAKECGVEIKE